MKRLSLSAQHLSLLALPALACMAASCPAQGPRLFTQIRQVPASVQAWHRADLNEDPTIVRAIFGHIDPQVLHLGRRARLELFDSPLELRIVAKQRSLRHTIYEAKLFNNSGQAAGSASFALGAHGVVAASLDVGDDSYALGYTGHGNIHRLLQLDHARQTLHCGNDHSHAIDAGAQRTVLPSSSVKNVDVAAFYTPRARSTGGGKAAIEAEIALRIANASKANVTCKVPWAFRLVHLAETKYTEDGSTSDLGRFRSRSAPMAEVHAARTRAGADLMVLITQPSRARYCGVGYLMTRLSSNFKSSAFSVTLRQCLRGHTLSHEMGHNCGSHHDRKNAGRALFPYSYGYRTSGNRYRSIMSYRPGTRVNQWSSASIQYRGQALGTANDDNARSLTNSGATIARFAPTRSLEWCEIKGAVAGLYGKPEIMGSGTVADAKSIKLKMDMLRDNAPGVMVLGAKELKLALFGGILVPSPDIIVALTAKQRQAEFDAGFLSTLPTGTKVCFQGWFFDKSASQGFSATAGIKTLRP